jgi:hypothetical protein
MPYFLSLLQTPDSFRIRFRKWFFRSSFLWSLFFVLVFSGLHYSISHIISLFIYLSDNDNVTCKCNVRYRQHIHSLVYFIVLIQTNKQINKKHKQNSLRSLLTMRSVYYYFITSGFCKFCERILICYHSSFFCGIKYNIRKSGVWRTRNNHFRKRIRKLSGVWRRLTWKMKTRKDYRTGNEDKIRQESINLSFIIFFYILIYRIL